VGIIRKQDRAARNVYLKNKEHKRVALESLVATVVDESVAIGSLKGNDVAHNLIKDAFLAKGMVVSSVVIVAIQDEFYCSYGGVMVYAMFDPTLF
jgi:bifunctional DNase/RNase